MQTLEQKTLHTPTITICKTNDGSGFTWISVTDRLRENGGTFPTLEAAMRDAYDAHADVPLCSQSLAAPDYHAAAIALITRHDEKARVANFDLCGRDDCTPFRTVINKARGN